ncbi:hypothetical protein TNCT_660852 [Trichonephila clavata]|uniref:Uncharacterized protein n=1 Tax=Trichonephila clavata TaxID=2740835 RepID=A0A8X6LV40_TRICU|nr:hypothetical protein TNCT_660852 [Trichonephila clavata]
MQTTAVRLFSCLLIALNAIENAAAAFVFPLSASPIIKLTAASHDTKYSLKIDKKKELDVKQMSALLLIAAERYFEQRDFTKLYQTLMFGVGLCPTYFKSPDAMEAVKVVHYIYQMTRDPQFVFPFAPTHQKILRRFFKKEASLWHKYVLSPNEEEEHTSVPSCALQTSQKPPRRYRG